MRTDSLIAGHLDLLILAILAERPAHGYAVMERLHAKSGGTLEVPEGSLYPALYRLEGNGWLRSSSKVVAGRRRRIYELTPPGRKELSRERGEWRALSAAIASVLEVQHVSYAH